MICTLPPSGTNIRPRLNGISVAKPLIPFRQILKHTSYFSLALRQSGVWIFSMAEPNRIRAKYVIGPDGSPLTIADLPPPTTKRWVIRRKAEVVAAVRGGLLSLDEACKRYTLTVDEFLSWQVSIDRHGLAGLRTTRIQQYRPGFGTRGASFGSAFAAASLPPGPSHQ
jgi:hypothetical protein